MADMRFAADEDFNQDILRGLIRRVPHVNVSTVQEAGRRGQPDPEILAWAAMESRILLTHDAKTMLAHAWDRIEARLPMPGVIIIPQSTPVGVAIRGLQAVIAADRMTDWNLRVAYLPL